MHTEKDTTKGYAQEMGFGSTPRSRLSRVLECLVVVWVLVGFLCVPAAMGASRFLGGGDFRQVLALITWDYPVLPFLAIAEGLTFMAWLFVGGSSESRLWRWLPPFVLLPLETRFQREAFVFLFALVALIGAVGILAGAIKPDWR
jgi:hypothetical protein